MFQIGIVIVEPPAILHHCKGIINDKNKHDCKLPVMHHVETIECVVLNYSHDSKPDDRQLNGDPGPYPALTVLQQAQQQCHDERHNRDMVERNDTDITHESVVSQPIDTKHIPPNMAHGRRHKKSTCPQAQHLRGSDRRVNGIATSQPQIDGSHQG